MRKVLSTLMIMALSTAIFAQVPNPTKTKGTPGWKKDLEFIQNDVQPIIKEDILIEDWYRFVDDWRALNGGFSNTNSFFSMFPDTFVKNISLDETTNQPSTAWQGWHSIGAMFDPNDASWSDANLSGLRDWFGYTVDSIFFTYGYFRYTDESIVDTLIIQIYNADKVTDGSFTSTNSQFGVVEYDQDAGLGTNYNQTIKVPINSADSNALREDGTFFAKTFAVDIDDLQVPADGSCAATITYKPGMDYEFGDTLFYDEDLADFGINPPKKRFNRFGMLAAVQTPNYSPLGSQNNGLFIVRWNRYDDAFTGGSAFMNDKYYPNLFGNQNEDFGYYPYIAFKVNATYNTSAPELTLDNGFGLGNVYPNPANINDQMGLSFAVNSQERVTIDMFDLTGKKVKTITNGVFEKGEHNITFDIDGLNPGMYIYTMTAGNYTNSHKFNVIK